LKFNDDFLRRYLEVAPTALALERSFECEILSSRSWPGPVLDIGCGDGLFARILFAEKIQTGIDPNPVETAHAGEQNVYEEILTCFGDDIPKPDASYATVFSNSVLEHIPELMPVLKEVHRLMAPDASFYVTLPTHRLQEVTFLSRVLRGLGLRSQAERYGMFYNRFWRHHNVHTTAAWRDLFSQAGFEVVEEHTYIPESLSTLYDLLTPMALPSFFSKTLLNRWFFIPGFRRGTAPIIHAILSRSIARMKRRPGGVLVFYSLKKQAAR
jgi:SAM-dependent methyltransferase